MARRLSSIIVRRAWVPLARSMMIIGERRRNQPTMGIATSSRLATMATFGIRMRKARVSQADWWLATIRHGSEGMRARPSST